MPDNKLSLDWLILNHGEFLGQFGIDREKIVAGYSIWSKTETSCPIRAYLCELLRQAALFIIKNAENENEFYRTKLLIDTKMLEFSIDNGKEMRTYLLKQIRFDQIMIEKLARPDEPESDLN